MNTVFCRNDNQPNDTKHDFMLSVTVSYCYTELHYAWCSGAHFLSLAKQYLKYACIFARSWLWSWPRPKTAKVNFFVLRISITLFRWLFSTFVMMRIDSKKIHKWNHTRLHTITSPIVRQCNGIEKLSLWLSVTNNLRQGWPSWTLGFWHSLQLLDGWKWPLVKKTLAYCKKAINTTVNIYNTGYRIFFSKLQSEIFAIYDWVTN